MFTTIMNWLNDPQFTLVNDHVTWAEILGFITGGWCVWLCAKAKVLNFPIGILNAIFFLILFFYAKLYADGGLQILYVILGFMGWWQWTKAKSTTKSALKPARKITYATHKEMLLMLLLIAIGTPLLYWLLNSVNDVAPFWDALTTALSLVAQYLLNTKRIQNWLFWIIADLVYIPLYLSKGLALTSIVYILFLLMCFLGVKIWLREKNMLEKTNTASAKNQDTIKNTASKNTTSTKQSLAPNTLQKLTGSEA